MFVRHMWGWHEPPTHPTFCSLLPAPFQNKPPATTTPAHCHCIAHCLFWASVTPTRWDFPSLTGNSIQFFAFPCHILKYQISRVHLIFSFSQVVLIKSHWSQPKFKICGLVNKPKRAPTAPRGEVSVFLSLRSRFVAMNSLRYGEYWPEKPEESPWAPRPEPSPWALRPEQNYWTPRPAHSPWPQYSHHANPSNISYEAPSPPSGGLGKASYNFIPNFQDQKIQWWIMNCSLRLKIILVGKSQPKSLGYLLLCPFRVKYVVNSYHRLF